jgi:hypothetical protein
MQRKPVSAVVNSCIYLQGYSVKIVYRRTQNKLSSKFPVNFSCSIGYSASVVFILPVEILPSKFFKIIIPS